MTHFLSFYLCFDQGQISSDAQIWMYGFIFLFVVLELCLFVCTFIV